jgi:gliding motility-associated-like protein
MPASTPPGSGYKIRIMATSPVVTSNDTEIPLPITTLALGATLPNIITPNGDGLNDVFYITPSCLTIDLKVYNRWGKLVYEQAKYDNTWGGANLAAGVYFYLLNTSNRQERRGWIEISR